MGKALIIKGADFSANSFKSYSYANPSEMLTKVYGTVDNYEKVIGINNYLDDSGNYTYRYTGYNDIWKYVDTQVLPDQATPADDPSRIIPNKGDGSLVKEYNTVYVPNTIEAAKYHQPLIIPLIKLTDGVDMPVELTFISKKLVSAVLSNNCFIVEDPSEQLTCADLAKGIAPSYSYTNYVAADSTVLGDAQEIAKTLTQSHRFDSIANKHLIALAVSSSNYNLFRSDIFNISIKTI